MTYEPNLESKSKAIINARSWGIGLVTSSLGLGMFISEIQRIKDIIFNPLSIAYLTLFISTFFLVLLWIWVAHKDLDLCFEWLDPQRYKPPSSLKETAIIIGLGIILSILFFASRDPFIYSIIFTFYSVVVIFTNDHSRREIKKAIDYSKLRLEENMENNELKRMTELYSAGVNILELYFVKRPQTQRHIIITIFCLIGFGLAIYWKIMKIEIFGLISYIIFILIIIVSEIILANWRMNRDNNLRPIEGELEEIKRSRL